MAHFRQTGGVCGGPYRRQQLKCQGRFLALRLVRRPYSGGVRSDGEHLFRPHVSGAKYGGCWVIRAEKREAAPRRLFQSNEKGYWKFNEE